MKRLPLLENTLLGKRKSMFDEPQRVRKKSKAGAVSDEDPSSPSDEVGQHYIFFPEFILLLGHGCLHGHLSSSGNLL